MPVMATNSALGSPIATTVLVRAMRMVQVESAMASAAERKRACPMWTCIWAGILRYGVHSGDPIELFCRMVSLFSRDHGCRRWTDGGDQVISTVWCCVLHVENYLNTLNSCKCHRGIKKVATSVYKVIPCSTGEVLLYLRMAWAWIATANDWRMVTLEACIVRE